MNGRSGAFTADENFAVIKFRPTDNMLYVFRMNVSIVRRRESPNTSTQSSSSSKMLFRKFNFPRANRDDERVDLQKSAYTPSHRAFYIPAIFQRVDFKRDEKCTTFFESIRQRILIICAIARET